MAFESPLGKSTNKSQTPSPEGIKAVASSVHANLIFWIPPSVTSVAPLLAVVRLKVVWLSENAFFPVQRNVQPVKSRTTPALDFQVTKTVLVVPW